MSGKADQLYCMLEEGDVVDPKVNSCIIDSPMSICIKGSCLISLPLYTLSKLQVVIYKYVDSTDV